MAFPVHHALFKHAILMGGGRGISQLRKLRQARIKEFKG